MKDRTLCYLLRCGRPTHIRLCLDTIYSLLLVVDLAFHFCLVQSVHNDVLALGDVHCRDTSAQT